MIKDGIYIDLPAERYHADEAIGSHGLKDLLLGPDVYWWRSPLNPDREDEDTPAKIRGSALHKLVLEGRKAFDAEYVQAPHDEDMTPAEKATATKRLKAQYESIGKAPEILPPRDYRRILMANGSIAVNPDLAAAFNGGISEVSVFWTRGENVRMKARFDYLKPRGIGDLKSITNLRQIPIKRAIREAISNYRYDIQAAHYLEARRQMQRMLAADPRPIFGGSSDDLKVLDECAKARRWAFQWVFFSTTGSPQVRSYIVSPNNPMVEYARGAIDKAVDIWRENWAQFGRMPWLPQEKPEELFIDDMPAWFGRD